MAILPATGSAISFGQINRAYTNQTPGAAGNAPAGGQNIQLSSVLGNEISPPAGVPIKVSQTFGGQTTPY